MSDLCDACGEWHADPMCDEDPDLHACSFCGNPGCDGSVYNCLGGWYDEYNIHDIEVITE